MTHVRALAAQDEPRRAAPADQRAPRRHVARRAAAVHPLRDRELRPHHFERFLVPQGITGLWQVTARANAHLRARRSTWTSHTRGWSLGLDLRLLLRTPLQVLRHVIDGMSAVAVLQRGDGQLGLAPTGTSGSAAAGAGASGRSRRGPLRYAMWLACVRFVTFSLR